MSSREREHRKETFADVNLADNSVVFCHTVETVVEVAELFRDVDGVERLELWSDSAGWSGVERRDDGRFYRVNYSAIDGEYIAEEPVSRSTVRELVEQHIEDEDAGGEGTFRRGATPR